MERKLSLDIEDINVSTFETSTPEAETSAAIIGGGGASWPAICTCIGICGPTADIYCSGGCAPYALVQVA